jgi:ribosomal protein L21E
MYYPRYHGFEGLIKGAKGECYNVEISDHGRAKVLIVHPVHLKRT